MGVATMMRSRPVVSASSSERPGKTRVVAGTESERRRIGIGYRNKIDDAGRLKAFQVPQVVGAEAVDTYQRHLGG
jgi:hypothetical protein